MVEGKFDNNLWPLHVCTHNNCNCKCPVLCRTGFHKYQQVQVLFWALDIHGGLYSVTVVEISTP